MTEPRVKTGIRVSAQLRRAQSAGATGWIVKPFDPEKLTRAVNRVMP